MANNSIYRDIATRTGGDIYIGVVGPVRTGKSTFIKRFMDTQVLPYMESDYKRERATDELPQSSAGRTIMTTEPKFVPEDGATVTVDDGVELKVRLIDCVGYIVPSSLGYIENNAPRMVKTPWYDEEIPFNMAAELGTQKVINEHSTIGLVVTTDGSITDIPRDEYAAAEERVINELKAIEKPFAVLLNTLEPNATASLSLSRDLERKYGVPVCPVNCLDMDEVQIRDILERILREFPLREVDIELPKWLNRLDSNNPIRRAVLDTVRNAAQGKTRVAQLETLAEQMCDCEYIESARLTATSLGTGGGTVTVTLLPELFYQVLSGVVGMDVADDAALMKQILELTAIRDKYQKIANALDEAERTGYGIVMPTMEEMTLEEPEIIKQSGRYGIRLRAEAPSIHMMKATIATEVSPIVGSEKQSEELVSYLLREFEESPSKIWESNIFGTSLYGLVNEGLHSKLYRMPTDARMKLKETVERIINEGCSGLICIIV